VRPPRGRAAPEHGRQLHRNETQAPAVNSLNVLRASFNFFADCPTPLLYLMLRVKKKQKLLFQCRAFAACDYAAQTCSERQTPRGHLFTVISRICNESNEAVEFTKQSPPKNSRNQSDGAN